MALEVVRKGIRTKRSQLSRLNSNYVITVQATVRASNDVDLFTGRHVLTQRRQDNQDSLESRITDDGEEVIMKTHKFEVHLKA